MPQAFTADDLYLHRKVKSIHGVAGLDRVVCDVRSVDRDKNDYITDLWEFTTDGSGGRQLTFSGSDHSPRLSPSGDRVAFVSSRDGAEQLYCLPSTGAEARQVGSFEGGIGSLRWAPDGRALMATAAVAASPVRTGPWARLPDEPSGPLKVELGWRLPYKEDGIGNVLERSIHLFRVDAESGEKRQLTHGAFDVVAFDVSPDGASVAYARTREGRLRPFVRPLGARPALGPAPAPDVGPRDGDAARLGTGRPAHRVHRRARGR